MRLRKKRVVAIILFIVFIVLLIIGIKLFKNKDYEVEYSINDYNIVENYSDELYTFKVSNDNHSFSFLEDIKYEKKHKLIANIEEINLDNEICLTIKSDYFNYNPLCIKDEQEVDYHLVSDEMKEKLNVSTKEEVEERTYNNIKIYNLLDYNYLIWNYKGFEILSNEGEKTINILKNDTYDIPISKVVNNYLLIADYDSKYNFNKFYVINLLKGTKEEFKIKYDISFDSYILGSYDKSIYLVDKKNKIEYEIVPHKKKIRIVGTEKRQGTIYTENGFEKISLTKLSSKEYSFYDDNKYNYEIIGNKLYQVVNNNKLLVSNKEIKDIISINKDSVLYLVDDTLYLYNNYYGETKVMNYFEWNFNYKNNIYFY